MSRKFDVQEIENFSLVQVATRGNTRAAAAGLSSCVDMDVDPVANRVVENAHGLAVLWFGPGRWLIRASQLQWMPNSIDGCVVTDLSDSRRILRLSGPGVCDYLSGSCPLDLSAMATPPGSVALTLFDRFSILLHRRDVESFDLYVERSYAAALPGGLLA